MALRPIYFDTETTGVKFDRDKIIELAAFDPVLNKTFCSFINPKIPIPPESTRIHHITDEMVQDAPDFKTVAEQFMAFCEGDVVLVAHNGDSFDIPFMQYEFKTNGLTFPNYPSVDTLKWARKYRPDLPKHSLQFLRETFQIQANNAHRALDDVIILHQVFSLMIDDLSFETILECLSRKKTLDRMPFGKHQGKSLKDVPSTYVDWLHKNGALDKPENKELFEAFKNLDLIKT
ncbi:DNA polymerase III subunit epsilon [bacterium]|nr:DNA polymerase III subunit epsilon [bacterium]